MAVPKEVPYCKWAEGKWRRMLRVPRVSRDEADRLIREAHARWAKCAREHGWLERLKSVVVWLKEDGSVLDSVYTAGPESFIVLDTHHDHCGEECNGGTELVLTRRVTREALANR